MIGYCGYINNYIYFCNHNIITMNDAKYRVIRVKGKEATYLYEDFSYWDKEKRYSTHKRRCIGKLDENGNEVYNKRYLSRDNAETDSAVTAGAEPSGRKTTVSETAMVGQGMLFGLAESRCGIRKPLEAAFGRETADGVLALARYAVSQGKSLSRAGDWLESHGMGALGLSSQRVSEVLAGLSPDRVNTFLGSWLKRNGKGESCLFDITSISTYGTRNTLAEWGYNRDRESLEQVNLALMTSVESGLPLWYTVLPGSMSDSTVMEYVLGMLGKLGMPDFVFYGDRGFYSDANIAMLRKNKVGYVIPVPSRVGWQKDVIAENRDKLVSPSNLIECGDGTVVYGMTVARKDGSGMHRCHIYFDPARKDKLVADFMRSLRQRRDELVEGKPIEKYSDLYKKYFTVKEGKRKGRTVEYNDEAVRAYVNSDSCYWVLRSDRVKDARTALFNYRARNDVELNFDDLKNTTDLRRMRNHNDRTIAGKIFVMFVALVLKCQLRKDVNKIPPKERKYWSEQEFLDKVDSYSRVHFSGRYKDVHSTPTAAQRLIFDLMGLPYQFQGKMHNINATLKYD